jgi:hypothetical protein
MVDRYHSILLQVVRALRDIAKGLTTAPPGT